MTYYKYILYCLKLYIYYCGVKCFFSIFLNYLFIYIPNPLPHFVVEGIMPRTNVLSICILNIITNKLLLLLGINISKLEKST